jgi:hypothetical protein
MDALSTYSEAVAKVNAFYDKYPTLAARRKVFADKNKANPVTKKPERLADPEYVSYAIGSNLHVAGVKMLASIHAENPKRPEWLSAFGFDN